ncbi:MAG: DUF1700 domain-containing protein [Lachnospiraceae bacterium]|nr:DUF1700 domain-containing protein [Lachnospiraceae bacterium]
MTKIEFLQRLQKELESGMSAASVQEQLDYYSRYIEDQVRNGKDEAAVVLELGDPWAIAKTLLEVSGNEEFAKENVNRRPERADRTDSRNDYEKNRTFHIMGKWTLLLIILGVFGIFILSAAVIGGIIRLLAPVLLPVILVVFVIRILKQRR